MHRLHLPEPRNASALAFADPASAEAWLVGLAPKPAQDALTLILEQIEAIDSSNLPPPQAIALLNLLRSAAVTRQAIAEGMFTRKALPMLAEEEHAFDVAQQLWTRLGIAYLRLTPQCTPANRCLPLLRAATAFRVADHCHFVAARTRPALLDALYLSLLTAAEANGVLRRPLADPDYPQYGKGTISGQLAWAFLLRTTDPYHLSAIQLQVINRAFSRWRELLAFETLTGSRKHTYHLDLAKLLGAELPPEIPRYLDMRVVAHKLAQRIKGLQAGESPEALKLGRSLSSAAAIRLLTDIDKHLHPRSDNSPPPNGELDLVFGGEDAYALINNKTLNSLETEGAADRSMSYQRMAQFGFDRVSQMPTAVTRKLGIPSEHWRMVDGMAIRAPGTSEVRLLAPCLIAAKIDRKPKLGLMASLRADHDGRLSAHLRWLAGTVEAGTLKRLAPRGNKLVRVPAFVIRDGDAYSLIVPVDAGVRLGVVVELAGISLSEADLVPAEIIERGTDFIQYACQQK